MTRQAQDDRQLYGSSNLKCQEVGSWMEMGEGADASMMSELPLYPHTRLSFAINQPCLSPLSGAAPEWKGRSSGSANKRSLLL